MRLHIVMYHRRIITYTVSSYTIISSSYFPDERKGLSQGLHFGRVACCVFNLWNCHSLRVEFVAECEQLEHDWNELELEDDFNE